MLQKKLGQRIADLRKTRELTQTGLAKKIGCSVEFISLVERGVNAPSVAGLETFARVLKVEVADLFRFGRKSGWNHPRKTSLIYVYMPGFVEQRKGTGRDSVGF